GNIAHPEDMDISGDVKYHLGYSSDKIVHDKKIHLSLVPNPSHLEAVNSVVMGKTRATQDIIFDINREKVASILIHGDAAFSGQGIVAETLMMSDIDGYNVGGVIHIIINNQIGFTTNPKGGRSGRYPTEFAKIIGAPIFHVNGDDPDSVVKATILAVQYKEKYKSDVIIDIVCYRLYGHNEGDEPYFTQPIMYKNISNHKTLSDIYSEKLISENIVTKSDIDSIKLNFKK
ncbi:MAG: 2-oxoglutarate dehydrogenase E1 component, partial [Sphingobacteriaceae bacterium]